jgi:hypothetical protein
VRCMPRYNKSGRLAALFCLFTAQAPLGAAVLSGTVHDPQDHAIAGARVSLTGKAKGLVRQSESDPTGFFLFPSLEPGVYTVVVNKAGFRVSQVVDLTIEVGQSATVSVVLQIGEVRNVITVSAADQAPIEEESNALGAVVESSSVRDLPLNGRNFLQLGLLTGGAADISPANDNINANVGHPSRMIVLPGTLPYSVGYFLNGIPIRGSRDGELALNLSIAAIDQFQVQEGFLMPDQWANAAAVNVVSKSGTNQFHGEAFEFLRNGIMDAQSFFSNPSENVKDDLKQNQFGFALGGPLWKNRLWFHGFYEGLRQITGFSSAGYSPTSPMFAGNFSGTGRTIYNPASYDPISGTREPFPNNVIPPSQINPVARNLLPYYLPGSSLSSIPSNVFGNPRNTLNDDQGGVRLDAGVSEHQQLFAQIFHQNSPAANPGLYPLSGLVYNNQADLVMLAHTLTISPQIVNILRAAFIRTVAIGGNQAQNQNPLLGPIGIQNTLDQRGITAIDLQGYSSFGQADGTIGNRDNTWHVGEAFHYSLSKHSFGFGADLEYRRGWHENSNSLALGQLQFAPAFTAQLAPNGQGQVVPQANTGDAFADFLLGMPTFGQVGGLPVVQFRGTQFNPYVEDTWRVAPGLIVNYGLAWYVETPPNPQGRARSVVHGFDPVTGLITYAALGQLQPEAIHTNWNNFAPRGGFAWQPKFLKDGVIRAGAGVYYAQLPWVVAQIPLIVSPPFGGGQLFVNSLTTPVPTYVLGNNIFPPMPAAPLTSSYAASLPDGTLAAAADPNLRTGYVSQWNFSLQKGLGTHDSIELDYLGSSGHRLLYYTDISQCRPTPDLYCSAANKPWPRYDLIAWFDSSGNSSYEGMIARYHHRITGGLNLRFDYTFAKALTDAWQSSQSTGNQIATCRKCDKGPATFDVKQRAVASAVWEIPYGRGGRHRAIVGEWTVTGIATFATGQPVFLTAPNQVGGYLDTPLPNRVCDGRSSALSDNLRNNGFLWFNTACFPVPQVGYFGNSGRTVLYGPGLNNWDISLEKNVFLRPDAERLQIRVETFNTWNHTQFGEPNGDAGAGANFGRSSTSMPPRLIQVAVKLIW